MQDIKISQEELLKQLKAFNKHRKSMKQAHGFNSSPDKSKASCNSYVMTDYVSGHHYETVDGKRKRISDYSPLFDGIDEAFRFAKCQRQVFAGLNHSRRDIVVVDIDQSYEPCFTETEYSERIADLKSTCDSYHLPYPSYVEFHTDSGHCQAGWYLTEYFTDYNVNLYKTEIYKFLYKSLAKLFFTDENFRGGNIKNPYHELNRAFFLNRTPVDTQTLIDTLRKINTGIDFPEEHPKKKKVSKRKVTVYTTIDPKTVDYSRNCYAFAKTRTWMFKTMRDNKGKSPLLEEVVKQFEYYEKESLAVVHKDTIETSAQIRASAIGVYNFCRKNYDPKKAEEVLAANFSREVQETRRYFSILKRQATKAYKVLLAKQLKLEGHTQLDIAHYFECTQANVSLLLKSNSEDALEQIKAYLRFHVTDGSKKHQQFMLELKEALDYLGINVYELLDSDNKEIALSYNYETSSLEESSKNILGVFTSSSPPRGDPVILYLTWETILHSETLIYLPKNTA